MYNWLPNNRHKIGELNRRLASGTFLLTWLLISFGPQVVWTQESPESVADETVTEPTEELPFPRLPGGRDLSLDELLEAADVVVGASKFAQPLSQVPSSVSIITREEMQRYGHRTLADVLRSVRGLHVTYDRLFSALGTRGFNPGDFNSRVLVLVDGHRLNQNLGDAALIGTGFLLDLDLVQQIEIIRGPGSVIYGNNAFFGVINIITRRGADMTGIGGETSFAYGEFDAFKGRVSYGKLFDNDLELMLSGSWFDSRGEEDIFFEEFNTPTRNDGVFENGDADKYYSLFGSLRYHDLTLQGGHVRREKGNPTAQHFTSFNDPRHESVTERSYLSLKYDREFGDDWVLSANAYYDRYEFFGQFPFDVPFNALETDLRQGEWWGLEAQINKLIRDRHRVTLGAEYRDDFKQERHYRRIAPVSESLARLERTRSSYGVFFDGDASLIEDKLRASAGIRYDDYRGFGNAVNPRTALIYQPRQGSTLKAVYGTAFRTPNFFELFDPNHQDIKTEDINSYELIYEQKINENLRSTVSLFYNDINDLISFDYNHPVEPRFRNFEGAVARGVEFELEGTWTEGWAEGVRARLSYTYQETENKETNTILTDSPRHLAKLNLSVPVWRQKVFAGVEVQYTGPRTSSELQPGFIFGPGRRSDGFTLVNLTLFSEEIVKGLDISASLYNVFDTEYFDPATPFHVQDLIPQYGRTFQLKLTYRF